MNQSSKKYRLTEFYPAYTIEEWENTYKEFYVYCIKDKDALKNKQFRKIVNTVKEFLKSKGKKFI